MTDTWKLKRNYIKIIIQSVIQQLLHFKTTKKHFNGTARFINYHALQRAPLKRYLNFIHQFHNINMRQAPKRCPFLLIKCF
jgi:hypothetical protein